MMSFRVRKLCFSQVYAIGSALRINSTYVAIYRVAAYLLLISLAPFVAIFIITVRMLMILRSVAAQRRKSPGFVHCDRASKVRFCLLLACFQLFP